MNVMSASSDFNKNDISQITTYQSGIAQAAAHRVINRVVSDYLLEHGLTAMQWFTLGSIYDAGDKGIRISELMRKLQTTLPFVTNTVALLESKGMVRKVAHSGDSRIKLVSIAPRYRTKVQRIEDGLRDHLREVLYSDDNISRDELQAYIQVLYKIVGRAGS
jgi:DNA-binding MarR family transcriptional regulator